MLLLGQLEFEGPLLFAFLAVTGLLTLLSVFFWFRGFQRQRQGEHLLPANDGTAMIGFVDLTLGFFVWLGGQLAAGILMTILNGPISSLDSASPEAFRNLMLYSGLAQISTTFVTAFYFYIRYRNWSARHPVNWTSEAHYRTSAIAFIMILPIVLIIQWSLSLLVPYEHPTLEALLKDGSPLTIFACWFAAVLAAPITEEFVFRGMLQNWLQRLNASDINRNEILIGGELQNQELKPATGPLASSNQSPPIWPIFVTSALFAMAHLGQGLAPIPLFVFSVMLGFLYRQTHSLIPCILVHFMLNAYSMTWFTLGSLLIE